MPITVVIVIIVSVTSFFSFAAYMVHVKSKTTEKEQSIAEQHNNEIAELKQRIEVLEKVITDDGYDLKKEIDALKKAG